MPPFTRHELDRAATGSDETMEILDLGNAPAQGDYDQKHCLSVKGAMRSFSPKYVTCKDQERWCISANSWTRKIGPPVQPLPLEPLPLPR